MKETEVFDRCEKKCFASIGGKCAALETAIQKDCPFQRTDITMRQQMRDIERYSYLKDYYNKEKNYEKN